MMKNLAIFAIILGTLAAQAFGQTSTATRPRVAPTAENRLDQQPCHDWMSTRCSSSWLSLLRQQSTRGRGWCCIRSPACAATASACETARNQGSMEHIERNKVARGRHTVAGKKGVATSLEPDAILNKEEEVISFFRRRSVLK